MVALGTRRIAADPQDASAYASRAGCYDSLHNQAQANADMRRWSAILSGSDLQAAMAQNTKRVINGPFECQLVFSAERPVNVNEIPLLNVAFGQKGRCSMKSFQMPILSIHGLAMSLLGLCVLSGLDAPPARADFTFGEPVNVQSDFPFVDIATDSVDCFSADGLEMYFDSPRAGGQGDLDIWVSERASIQDDWGPPENLGATVNSASVDGGASISADGLSLYFTHDVGPAGRLYVAKRATKQDNWGTPVSVGAAVNTANAVQSWISADELELYFQSNRPGGQGNYDMWVTTRATVNDKWGPPVNLGPTVNSPNWDGWPSISPDGLLLFFCSNRPGAHPWGDIYVARRASRSAPWQPAVNLGPIVNRTCWNAPFVSADGSALYIHCDPNCDMTYWTYKAPILPIVDFNADGKVDRVDMGTLMLNWGTDKSLYDIGPTPLGDGIVDSKDLMVLAQYGAMLAGDVNYDGVVDFFDLAEVANNWLQQQP